MRCQRPPACLWLPFDAIASFDADASPVVGGCEPQRQNAVGGELRDIASEFGLRLPSTLVPPGPIWVSSVGLPLRLDYVAIPQSWHPVVEEVIAAVSLGLGWM